MCVESGGYVAGSSRAAARIFGVTMVVLLGLVVPIYRLLFEECKLNHAHYSGALSSVQTFRILLFAFSMGWLARVCYRHDLWSMLMLRYEGKYTRPLWDRASAVGYANLVGLFGTEIAAILVPFFVVHSIGCIYFIAHREFWELLDPWTGEPIGRPAASAVISLAILSATYSQAVFLVPCALFRLCCALVLLRLHLYHGALTNGVQSSRPSVSGALDAHAPGSDTELRARLLRGQSDEPAPSPSAPLDRDEDLSALLKEHTALKELLSAISHRFRLVLVGSTLLIALETAYSMYFLMVDTIEGHAKHREGTEFAVAEDTALSVYLILNNIVHIVGVWAVVRAATVVTHRARMIPQAFASLHLSRTLAGAGGSTGYERRQAFQDYLSSHPLGLTLYGFSIDRDFLRSWHMVVISAAVFLTSLSLRPQHSTVTPNEG
ncbi:unnamed protein product [Pedinophyceae sp. YPF-701]|nr:unnamed protein product [Pedinophyceae sp. YPF-701]